MPRPRLHLICNAHIDPVWLWEWPEGAGEALATFRLAAELCESDRTFVFSHNEALLYRWVQAFEPPLFRRIRSLVRRGRWNILGGWYVQPDVNLPSGESLVRQILLGKRYFRDVFGIDVRTAANLDPFGHTRGLVQILARSGYRSYLFCRPDPSFLSLPADEFIWTGFDGSEVLATRVSSHYNSKGGEARAKVEAWLKDNADHDIGLVLWGVGNHGGGPSRRDLDELRSLASEKKNRVRIFHSTADAWFADLEKNRSTLPRVNRSLNPWAVGCYTTMARVKQAHRRLEGGVRSAEKMAAAAFFQGFMPYPAADLDEAARDLALAEFHDILPGSSVAPAEEGALRLLGHGQEISDRMRAAAFFALAAGESPGEAGSIPVFVHNPHPYKFQTTIECELQNREPQYDGRALHPRVSGRGRALASQTEKEASNLGLEWRKKIVFEADLAPSALTRFNVRLEPGPDRRKPALPVRGGRLLHRTGDLEIAVGSATGLIERFRFRGRDILAPSAFRLLVLEDDADPWGMSVTGFRRVAGAFSLADPVLGTALSGISGSPVPSVRVIEDGDVRTVVEAVFAYGRSDAVLRYVFPKIGAAIGLEIRVRWNERDRMLKLSIPTRLSPAAYWGQVAYGREELPSDGSETVSQSWTAVVRRDGRLALTVINEGTYGSDFDKGEIRLSLLRGAAHAADPAKDRPMRYRDRDIPRIDQGERVFRFRIQAGPAGERMEAVDREAQLFNEPPYVLPYFPPGAGRRSKPFVRLGGPAILLAALKKSEDGRDLILRLFEPTGRRRATTLSLPLFAASTRVRLGPFEIKTLRFNPRTKTFRETDLLELPLGVAS